MLLSELIDEVYIQTNRHDLVNETAAAVKSATLFAHHSDFYSRDLYETGIQFDESSTVQSLETSVIKNYRKVKWARKYDVTSSAEGEFFAILTPEEMLDAYGIQKDNVAYEAASVINFRSNSEFQYILIGAYVSPDVTGKNYNSWIADNFPYLIIFNAARIVMTAIGDKEGARNMKELAAEQLLEFRSSALATVGE